MGLTKPAVTRTVQPVVQKQEVKYGLYKVLVPKAYFHNTPDENTKRVAYMIKSEDTVTALKETGEFIYTEFYNARGQLSKGWLRKKDLFSLNSFSNSSNFSPPVTNITNSAIENELERAAVLAAGEQYPEALLIYSKLAKKGVPEAMYEYGDLAMKGRNDEINCIEGMEWLNKAALKNNTAAKRTLGFLYLFAGNDPVIIGNNYLPCPIQKDSTRGAKLLIDAVSDGDTMAIRFLEQINKAGQGGR